MLKYSRAHALIVCVPFPTLMVYPEAQWGTLVEICIFITYLQPGSFHVC